MRYLLIVPLFIRFCLVPISFRISPSFSPCPAVQSIDPLPIFLALGGGVLERLGVNLAEQIMFGPRIQILMGISFKKIRKKSYPNLQRHHLLRWQVAPP
jgi:hypothetical protein